MKNTISKNIKQLSSKPNILFLIDSIGALATAFFLYVVLRNFNQYFRMPITILNYLSAIAACLCIYSTICLVLIKENWIPFIIIISIANLLYCILTIGLVIFYHPKLTIFGTTYFLGEIAIILGLVYIELNVASAIKKSNFIDWWKQKRR
jgi:hypothetical protein